MLVGAASSSATFQIVQQSKLGLLVGQPAGGNQRGVNGGAFFFPRLPNAHLEADLPPVGQFPSIELPDAGLAPDVPVQRTVQGIAQGRDEALGAALRTLRRGR